MRVPEWPELLAQHLADAAVLARAPREREDPYRCAVWCADWVLLATGRDPAAGLRNYSGKREALAIIAPHGSFEGLITHCMGHEPIHAAHLDRGDVVLANLPLVGGEVVPTLGIMEAADAFFLGSGGYYSLPRLDAALLRGWRVN